MTWVFGVLMPVFLVVAMGILAVYLIRSETKKRREARNNSEIRQVAAWMAAYFGTFRPEDYNPNIKEESTKMLVFLNQFDVPPARTLKEIVEKSLLAGALPKTLALSHPDVQFLAPLIKNVCLELKAKQNSVEH